MNCRICIASAVDASRRLSAAGGLVIGFALAAVPLAAAADGKTSLTATTGGVDVKLEQALVQHASGKAVGKDEASAARTAPGDIIEYTATYSNKGKETVKGLAGVLPVPAGVSYVAGTAKPAGVQASLDGKTYAPVPLKRKVKGADGREKEVDVPPSEYRSLRWELGTLAPSGSTRVSARMQLNPVGQPEAAAQVPAR